MTSEEAKKYLEYLLTAYAALTRGDADYRFLPFPKSKLPMILRDLAEEVRTVTRIAKGKIETL